MEKGETVRSVCSAATDGRETMPDTLMQTPAPQAGKPWLQSYPPGMPADIAPLPYNSIGDLFAQSCKKYADRAAFT